MIFGKSSEFNPNYCAHLARVSSLSPIEGADKIQIAVIRSERIIIGKNIKEGEVLLFFPVGTEITPTILTVANLWADPSKNLDPSANPGLFKNNGRVRSVRIRGIQSPGLAIPLGSILSQDLIDANKEIIDKLCEPESSGFDIIDNLRCCRRASVVGEEVVPIRKGIKRKRKTNKGAPRILPGYFSYHYDTQMLADNIWRIDPETELDISIKMHGTSCVLGNLPCWKPLANTWIGSLLSRGGWQQWEQRLVCSSRNRLRGLHENSIYNRALSVLGPYIKEDESWYCEIIGYDGKNLLQRDYDYGCEPGEFKIVPYRITRRDIDVLGFIGEQELSISDVLERTRQVDTQLREVGKTCIQPLDCVFSGKAKELCEPADSESIEDWRVRLLETLKTGFGLEGPEPMCKNRVPREGLALRLRNQQSTNPMAYKLKSAAFWKYEGF